jgi:hypothetical protein
MIAAGAKCSNNSSRDNCSSQGVNSSVGNDNNGSMTVDNCLSNEPKRLLSKFSTTFRSPRRSASSNLLHEIRAKISIIQKTKIP